MIWGKGGQEGGGWGLSVYSINYPWTQLYLVNVTVIDTCGRFTGVVGRVAVRGPHGVQHQLPVDTAASGGEPLDATGLLLTHVAGVVMTMTWP